MTSSRCASTGGYVPEAFCLLQDAGIRNQAIDTDCGPVLAHELADPRGRCRRDVTGYAAFLQGAQSDLHLGDLAAVPASVREPALYLSRAVRDDLSAARLATTALDTRDMVSFLRAWGLHGKAGSELQAAGAVFASR